MNSREQKIEYLTPLKKLCSEANWSNLDSESFKDLKQLTQNLLNQCGVGEDQEREVRLNKPWFMDDVENLNKRKKEISQDLEKLDSSTGKLKFNINETMNLYKDSIRGVLEIVNREIGIKD